MALIIVCVVYVICICCLDLSKAINRYPTNEDEDPGILKYNGLQRVSDWKCKYYSSTLSGRKYNNNLRKKCEDCVGITKGQTTNDGEYPHMKHSSRDSVDVRIKRTIKHPKYQSPIVYNDIAILELNIIVRFTKDIKPACLWNKKYIAEYSNNLTVTGWGKTKVTGKGSGDLLVAHLNLVNVTSCQSFENVFVNRNMKEGLIDSQICAANFKTGSDTCEGDSGGPLQFKIQNSSETSTTHYVVGITSIGHGCGSLSPGVYTNVASFNDWIEATVWPDEFKTRQKFLYNRRHKNRNWVW